MEKSIAKILWPNQVTKPKKPLIFTVITPILDRIEPLLRRGIDHTLEVERCQVAIDGLPHQLEWARIIHISDMHFHENWEPVDMAIALFEQLQNLKWEAGGRKIVCVFTGDMLSKHADFDDVHPCISCFMGAFREVFWPGSRLYACEGNHDVLRPDWESEKKHLEAMGMDYSGEWRDEGIHIVSTPDYTVDQEGARIKLQESLQAHPGDDVLRIILSHNPEVLTNMPLPQSEIPQIIMGGHTHAGHCGLISDPSFSDKSDMVRRLMARVLLGSTYPLVSGVKRLSDNIFVSVSPGVGENEKRPRCNSPRGLTVFTLRTKTK